MESALGSRLVILRGDPYYSYCFVRVMVEIVWSVVGRWRIVGRVLSIVADVGAAERISFADIW